MNHFQIDNMGAPFQGNIMLANLMPEGKAFLFFLCLFQITSFLRALDSPHPVNSVTKYQNQFPKKSFYGNTICNGRVSDFDLI